MSTSACLPNKGVCAKAAARLRVFLQISADRRSVKQFQRTNHIQITGTVSSSKYFDDIQTSKLNENVALAGDLGRI